MTYTGKVKKESLKDDGFLNFTSTRHDNGEISFEIEDDFAPAIVAEMSEELRSGANFAVIKNEYSINVVFPEKVFTFEPKDQGAREKMFKYAESLGISPKDLEGI